MKPHGWLGSLLTGLCVAIPLLAVGCHHQPAPPAKTTPQMRLDWNLNTLVVAYDKNLEGNLNGEDSAHAALTEFARVRAKVCDDAEPWVEIISTNCQAAINAGCDDPQVRYLYLRYSPEGQNMEATARAAAMLKVAEKMEKSNYPPIRKFYAQFRAMEYINETYNYRFTNMPPEAQSFVTQNNIMVYINQALADKAIPVEEAYDACHELLLKTYDKNLYQDTSGSFQSIFSNRWPETELSLLLKGETHYQMAWHARGGGYANKVTPEGWKGFQDHLAVADDALNRAWKIDSKDVRIPNLMIKLAEAMQKSRPEMDAWFDRAMDLNPANYEACTAKLHYLYPQWYGSREDMLAFGRECVKNSDWSGEVPLILADAHWDYSRYLQAAERTNYWKQPDVWPDIKASYTRFFQVNTNSLPWHHNLAWYAYQCGQWDEFINQLPQMGYTNYEYFGGKDVFDSMVQTARANGSHSQN